MNLIKLELCEEDRARLDRLAEALERRGNCEACVNNVMRVFKKLDPNGEAPQEVDPVEQKLAETLAQTTDPVEVPVVEDAPAPAPEPKREVSLAEFQKALTLRCSESEGMKAKVRALLNQYAAAASQVPPDKREEVLEKLAKL